MLTKLSIMVKASMLVMRMVMVFTSRAAGAVHCNTQEGVCRAAVAVFATELASPASRG